MTGKPALAYFQGQGPGQKPSGDKLEVHFNPTSLKISLTNQFGEGPPQQHAKPTTTKLDVELVFDTTHDGNDVRTKTDVLRNYATATGKAKTGSGGKSGDKEESNHSLPLIYFCWGTTKYLGLIESMTETLDYWSSDGVPMRATVQLGMKGAEKDALTHGKGRAGAYGTNPVPTLSDVGITPAKVPPESTGTTGTATEGGDPGAGRMLAANNGLENMRAPTGASLGAAAGVQLAAAASFQMSGGISAGASIGFGFGASAGASIGAGLGASVGVGMAAGAGIGLGASAGAGFGIGASAGASFGIGASAGAGFGMGAAAGAGFGIGGAAGASFGMGASAGVGIGMGGVAGLGGMTSAGSAIGIGAGASAGFSMNAGGAAGLSSGGGFGLSTSMTTSVTGFDGVTRTETSSSFTGLSGSTSSRTVSMSQSSAGVAASYGAFAGLGVSKTVMANASFDPDRLLAPPSPWVGPYARFESTGRLVTSNGQVAASYTARESVVVF